jgi:membrane associated rhomboid family serine protease
MIPLRSTERVSSPAVVTGSIIALNTLVFLYQATLSPLALDQLVQQWGIVPDERPFNIASLFTSMFLHGGWLHLIFNMLYLWVFGRNIEDLIGGAKFLLFYFLCGLASGVTHVIFNAYSHVPTIGASGAIAGVMGAYLIRFPKARIVTVVVLLIFFTTMDLPAAFLLLFWFALQFLNGVGTIGEHDYTAGGTAYFAHIGGFIAGMLLIRLFPARQRWRTWYEE